MKDEIVVFKNNKKVGAQPDYRATIRIGGTEYEEERHQGRTCH
jgi:hypothetical protein